MSEKDKSEKPVESGAPAKEASEDVNKKKVAVEDLGGDLNLDAAVDGEEDLSELDDIIGEIDPSFKDEMTKIENASLDNQVIDESLSEPVDENTKIPPAWKLFLKNLPKDQKVSIVAAIVVVLVFVPVIGSLLTGKLLPKFELPYAISMNDFANQIYAYPTEDEEIPLFDDFRSNTFSLSFPSTTINLKEDGDKPAYGKFEFFFNLREKEFETKITDNRSEIIDLIQRTLEQVTWAELQSPIGKEKVKKVLRHRINGYLKANIILGVYYRSILLSK